MGVAEQLQETLVDGLDLVAAQVGQGHRGGGEEVAEAPVALYRQGLAQLLGPRLDLPPQEDVPGRQQEQQQAKGQEAKGTVGEIGDQVGVHGVSA